MVTSVPNFPLISVLDCLDRANQMNQHEVLHLFGFTPFFPFFFCCNKQFLNQKSTRTKPWNDPTEHSSGNGKALSFLHIKNKYASMLVQLSKEGQRQNDGSAIAICIAMHFQEDLVQTFSQILHADSFFSMLVILSEIEQLT